MGGNWPVPVATWQEGAHSAHLPIKPVGAGAGLCQSNPRAGALGDEAQSQHPNCSPFLDRSAPLRGRPAPFPVTAGICDGLCPSEAVDIAYRAHSDVSLRKENTEKGSIPRIGQSSHWPSRRSSASPAVSTPISSVASPALPQALCLPTQSAAMPSPARSSVARLARPATISARKPANNLIRPSGRKTNPDRHGCLRAPVAVLHLKDLA